MADLVSIKRAAAIVRESQETVATTNQSYQSRWDNPQTKLPRLQRKKAEELQLEAVRTLKGELLGYLQATPIAKAAAQLYTRNAITYANSELLTVVLYAAGEVAEGLVLNFRQRRMLERWGVPIVTPTAKEEEAV